MRRRVIGIQFDGLGEQFPGDTECPGFQPVDGGFGLRSHSFGRTIRIAAYL
jgi:hypothetical protein